MYSFNDLENLGIYLQMTQFGKQNFTNGYIVRIVRFRHTSKYYTFRKNARERKRKRVIHVLRHWFGHRFM